MTKKKVKGTASYADALLISQNLAEMTAYELAGDQILVPDNASCSSSIAQSLILMPGVTLASEEMAKGIAMLGTSALGVRCLIRPEGERTPDFAVLFAENGKAERFASLRPWFDRQSGLYLIPDQDTAAGSTTCFKFERGLRKAEQPWADEAHRHLGVAEATALLLAKGPITGPAAPPMR